ncbi:cell envelope integrity protein CreD [Altericroceibacterium spongiae]|uniref:Cell envelope integrity protein CreD n=1 Tax=Altericroceibacterium spongiae TaxID=2320269 RepID=A0A420EF12_9SPHN|nr:cell envelope integrity protein CreD [Altericroceibacterium spongiae]RKF19295.1 cell envelope integrity protein CreD [Altericroceibacterium spongiae]
MKKRSPGFKLLMVGLVAFVLIVPLLMVYFLVQDRQDQSTRARDAVTMGWGGEQVISGPVLVIPYMHQETQIETVKGQSVTHTQMIRDQLYLAPQQQDVHTSLSPQTRSYSIYKSVIYAAELSGKARFALPEDLERQGVSRDQLLLDQAELRFGVSDPRGLQEGATVKIDDTTLPLQPGKGLASSGNSGFFGFVDWSGAETLDITWSYSLRGSHGIALVPRGGKTTWHVESLWPHPSFGGSFLPDSKDMSDSGFKADYAITNLALGQSLLLKQDPEAPMDIFSGNVSSQNYYVRQASQPGGPSMGASISLLEPVNLYSQVDRSVKYGFLFIGFTFLAFFMFDIVGGARVAAAEYLLTGAGLVLFFVLLLAFAEMIGFTWSYIVASAAIIGLLTSYSAAILKGWRRAGFIGALLIGLYALIYVLLSLEALSLVIGAVLLFVALAGVMFVTRRIDWSSVGRQDENMAESDN